MPFIPVNRVVDTKHKKNNWKKWMAKEEERHKVSPTNKTCKFDAMPSFFLQGSVIVFL
jgi:hypothetical protein